MTKESVVQGSVLVAGGGVSGIKAALDLAESGFYVYLVEKSSAIGGVMAQLDKTFPTSDCSMCILSPYLVETGRHQNIELITNAEIQALEGSAGNFEVTVNKGARYIDLSKCTGCGDCAEVCPVTLPNAFDMGMGEKKATFKSYAQAVPGAYSITKKDKSPCTQQCPNHVNAHGYVAMVSQGKYKEALEVITRNLPLPGIIGRICPHPCEDACRRGEVDSPISICTLKRFVADQVDLHELPLPEITKRDEKVAIIGAGPAGLTAAYFLALEGFQVKIFEKLPVAGGMLKVGIPDYRLPGNVLDKEISWITRLGVEIQYDTALGEDITVDGLMDDGYKSVFLAIGCHNGMKLGIEGEETQGVMPGVDMLRDAALNNLTELKGNVVIIGGGDVAIDAARTSLRLGADNISILYRRTRAEMPARNEEIEDAIEEDIDIQYLTAPCKVVEKDGKVVGIECIRMELGEPDASGRRRPVPVDGSEFVLDADVIIPAIGQQTDSACLDDVDGVEINKWRNIDVDPITYMTEKPGVFAGGDGQTGASIAIAAVAAGREAAISITRYINGEDMAEGREKVDVPQKDFNEIPANVESKPRLHMARIPMDQRKSGMTEVELGFTEEQAKAEADKCLNCMVCCECLECTKACGAGALTPITHMEKDEQLKLGVGSIILSPGFTPFDPSSMDFLGYKKTPNVVTSMEFERILSASGPFGGHLVRPSDHKEPKRIAWLQCVGSRDQNRCGNGHCSSVCCMYAIKEAVIAKEHAPYALDCSIFYMDMRTHGKDFERFYDTARDKHAVNFVKSRVHSVIEVQGTTDLELTYSSEDGQLVKEVYDMVVLSVGLETPPETVDLAKKLGVELTPSNFADTGSFTPVNTSKDGIYVCGAFQGPRDIPQSVVDSSAAAAAAGEILGQVRHTLTKEKEVVPEINVVNERPRIGVFVCNCGININGVVDVPAVRDYAANLPFVEYVTNNMYTCSQDTQDSMVDVIKEKKLNRVVVAACTPKTHEPLFQETLINSGLNKYLFEMVNIRNHASWVHKDDPAGATEKAKDLVRMSVAKVGLMQPLKEAKLQVGQAAMVLGGGISGMSSALSLARQGYETHLIEREDMLGGQALNLFKTVKGEDIQTELQGLIREVNDEKNLTVHLNTTLENVEGFVGSYVSELSTNGDTSKIDHGIAVIATGAKEMTPVEYAYGKDPRILTSLELDQKFLTNDPVLETAQSAVFIQCVGSREKERPYCSRVCCTHSVENALELKKRNPEMNVYVLYRDIRTYGEKELAYAKARDNGVIFIRYKVEEKPVVEIEGDSLYVTVKDHVLGVPLKIDTDILTLASAIVPHKDERLAQFFKVPLNDDGFFVERHAKLGPSEFATDGVFLCGLAHYPKPIEEAVAQGKAASSRAVTLLARENIYTSGTVAQADPMFCASCGVCVAVCPYSAPSFTVEGRFKGKAEINPVLCKGCGLCVASCRSGAIHLNGFDNDQIFAQIFSGTELIEA